MTSLTLVIPCKDEAKRLMTDAFLDALRDYPYLSFLFVDDGSTDDTAEVLALLERQSPAIHALYLPKNVGKVEARPPRFLPADLRPRPHRLCLI